MAPKLNVDVALIICNELYAPDLRESLVALAKVRFPMP